MLPTDEEITRWRTLPGVAAVFPVRCEIPGEDSWVDVYLAADAPFPEGLPAVVRVHRLTNWTHDLVRHTTMCRGSMSSIIGGSSYSQRTEVWADPGLTESEIQAALFAWFEDQAEKENARYMEGWDVTIVHIDTIEFIPSDPLWYPRWSDVVLRRGRPMDGLRIERIGPGFRDGMLLWIWYSLKSDFESSWMCWMLRALDREPVLDFGEGEG